jgi:hypothetical protein
MLLDTENASITFQIGPHGEDEASEELHPALMLLRKIWASIPGMQG